MKEEQDDLTLVYMFGYKNGKDSLKDEIERLLLIEQGAAEPCDTCGWRMKFPNAECRNCENAKLRDEIERLRERGETTEWFWRIVDADGLGNVPSDEAAALNLLVWKANLYDASRKREEALRAALHEWDALIEHQYSGSQEAMSDMTYAAQRTAHLLHGKEPWPEPRRACSGEDK